MKKSLIAALVILNTFISIHSKGQTEGKQNSITGKAIALDDSGNVYSTGYFKGTAKFGTTTLKSAGGADIFVAKTNKDGKTLWAFRAGGEKDDEANDIEYFNGKLMIVGGFGGWADFGDSVFKSWGYLDIFILRMTTDGKIIRNHAISSGLDDYATSIVSEDSNTYYIAGRGADLNTFGKPFNGSGRYFIARMDITETCQWVTRNAASFKVEFSMKEKAIYACGNTHLKEIWLGKYARNGDLLWEKITSSSVDKPNYSSALAVNGAGNVFVTGGLNGVNFIDNFLDTCYGNYDTFFWEVSRGATLNYWQKSGSPGYDFGNNLICDVEGNAIVTGVYSANAHFGGEVLEGSPDRLTYFLSKMNTTGVVWTQSITMKGDSANAGLTSDANGNIYLLGVFNSSIRAGNLMLTGRGNDELFLAMYGREGYCNRLFLVGESMGSGK